MPTYIKTSVQRSELRKTAMGDIPADVIYRGAQLVNTTTGSIYDADIAVKGERIAAVGDIDPIVRKARRIINIRGKFVTPGLIDGHIHIESSMLTPDEFSSLVLPHGTTTISADFHEIANILGITGMRLFHDILTELPLRIFPVIPSSVPLSTTVEFPTKTINLHDIEEMMKWADVLGLGEILNVHGLITGSKDLDEKIKLALKYGKFIDGNAAGISGTALEAYVASGPQHDHEAVSENEASERLKLGMWVMLREGSSERNLRETIRVLLRGNVDSRRFCFATDDKTVSELDKEGHLDHCVRKSIRLGLDPVRAIQMATINCAEYLGLEREIGSVSPGKVADFLIISNLEEFNIQATVVGGKKVAEGGKFLLPRKIRHYPKFVTNTFHLSRRITPSDLDVRTRRNGRIKIRVIDVTQETIISKKSVAELMAQDSKLLSDVDHDILKTVVVERFGVTSIAIGKAFMRGFGLKDGALASSIAHDTHNIISVGATDADIAVAVNRVAEIQGGLVAVKQGRILGELRLLICGIISLDRWERVSENLQQLERVVKNELGCMMKSPFMVLSFQSSASIPELKVSTRGLIDMPSMRLVPITI